MKHCIIVLFMGMIGLFAPQTQHGTEEPEAELQREELQREELQKRVLLKSSNGTYWSAQCDLGTVSAGDSVELTFDLEAEGSGFIFTSYDANCACRKLKIEGDSLVDGATARGVVSFVAKSNRLDGLGHLTVELGFQGQSRARIQFNYRVSGNLFLDDSRTIFDVTKGANQVSIPMSFTAPISQNDLTLKFTQDSGDRVDFLVEKKQLGANGWHALISFPGDDIKDFASGVLVVEESRFQKVKRCPMLFAKVQPIKISPAVSYFIKESGGDQVAAKVFCRIQDLKLFEENPNEFSVKVRLKGVLLETKLRKISDGIYRIAIRLPESLLAGGESKLQWQFSCRDETYRVETIGVVKNGVEQE